MVTSEVAKVVMGGGTCFKWWWQVSSEVANVDTGSGSFSDTSIGCIVW